MKAKPSSEKTLLSYITKYRLQFLLQAIGGVIYNTVTVSIPILIGKIIDIAGKLEQSQYNPDLILQLAFYCIGVVVVVLVVQYARYLKRWYLRDLSNRVTCDLRFDLVNALLHQPIVLSEQVGDLMSRTVSDVDYLIAAIKKVITELWDTWLVMLTYFVTLLILNPKITLLCAIPIPIALLLAESIRHPLYRYSLNSRKATSLVHSHLQRTLNGVGILRLFGREQQENKRLEKLCKEQIRWNIKTSLLQEGLVPIYLMIATLGVVGVIGLGGKAVIGGSWSYGDFSAYLSIFILMAARTTIAAKVFNMLHSGKAAWDRIKEKLRESSFNRNHFERDKQPSVVSVVNHDLPSSQSELIHVDSLSFQYPRSEQKILNDICFSVKENSLTGITGSIGSGKTALSLCLSGFYPYDGKISLRGRELREFSDKEKSTLFSYMGNSSFLFSTTIAENITFQNLNRQQTEADLRLQQAIYLAALQDDLILFPEGLQTIIGEKGTRLSGGQRQRVLLARAYYADTKILLLDDPFSAVDIGTEQRMIDRMIRRRQDSILSDRTIFVFSHRLALFPFADTILVLNRGTIEEQGIHSELCRNDGIYRKIYAAQSWLEGEDDENKR